MLRSRIADASPLRARPRTTRRPTASLVACLTRACGAVLLLIAAPAAWSQSLDFVTPNRSLGELERSMTNHYLDLERRHELPVQRITDDIGLLPKDMMYQLGLIRGRTDKRQFPDEMASLLQRLNPQLWRKKSDGSIQWLNKKGDSLCVPAVAWKDALTLVRVKVPKAADPVADINARLGTCAVMGEACREKLLARLASPDAQGTIAVAALAQGALFPEADAPTSCADAPAIPMSAKLDTDRQSPPLQPVPVSATSSSRGDDPASRERMALDLQRAARWQREMQGAQSIAQRSAAAPRPSPTINHSIVARSAGSASISSMAVPPAAPAPAEVWGESIRSAAPTAAAPADEMIIAAAPLEMPEAIESAPMVASAGDAVEATEHADAMILAAAPEETPEAIEREPLVASVGDTAEATEPTEATTTPEATEIPAAPAATAEDETVDLVSAPARVAPGAAEMLMAGFDNPVLRDAGLIQRRMPGPNQHRVGVLVFDTPVTGCHFVLRQAIRDPACPVTTSLDAPPSFWMLPLPTDVDHGAHICGLIAGGMGVGVHPGARVRSIPMIKTAGSTVFNQDMQQDVMDALVDASAAMRVANFSTDLNAKDTNVSKLLADGLANANLILVVAAAGNAPGPLNNNCNVVPACLSLGASDNLAVVGGVQKTSNGWELWNSGGHGSAFGEKVHLLAPAAGVVSAVHLNGWMGAMSGTSQSAAIVSGLAARLFETTPPPASIWSPAQVRNRLMATARITDDTLTWSRSGVVDGDRALDTDTQVLRRKIGGSEEELRGRLMGVVGEAGADPQSAKLKNSEVRMMLADGTGADYDYCRFYRISRMGQGNKWMFAYQPRGIQSGARWAAMELHGGVAMATFSKALLFQSTGANEPIRVPVGDVLDFYDEFSGRLACQE